MANHPAGRRADVKSTRTPVKLIRKRLTLSQRALLISFGIFLLALLEAALRFLPLGLELTEEGDPFVGFSSLNPLFISYLAADGTVRMKTAPGKLRWFNPQDFPARKEPGTFRIFTLGGSTAYGHPYSDPTSFSGWLRQLLKRLPGAQRRYEVINAGGISYASYREAVLLKELLAYEPDLFVIMTGHNEFLEARTYKDILNEPAITLKTREFLSRLATYRLLNRSYQSLKTVFKKDSLEKPPAGTNLLPPEVQTILDRSAGMELYQRDTLFSRGVYEHFHYNIARMKRLCHQAGVPLLFLEPVDNLKDFSPFKSQGRDGLDSRSSQLFLRTLSDGVLTLGRGQLPEGIGLLKKAMALDSLYADCHYYLGRAYLFAGDTAAAGKYLLQARELDVCPLRPTEQIHRILREETKGKDADLLDLPSLFRYHSPGGIIGDEMLIDHVHPYPEGYLLIALEIQGWMKEKEFFQGSLPSPAEIEVLYRTVMDSLPPEYFRHGIVNLAKTLIWAKKFREALIELNSQWEQLAGNGEAWYFKGSALFETGKVQEGIECLRKALELAPGHLMVLTKLAGAYLALGRIDSAKTTYETALEYYPDNAALLTDYGMLLNQSGQTDKALEYLRRAQRIDPGLPGLLTNIGLVYSTAGEYEKAREVFLEALKKAPGDPQLHLNLGLIHAFHGEQEEAERFFKKSLELKPDYVDAYINLGNVYQNTGRPDLAEEQFRKAMMINPDLATPYINLAGLYRETGRDSLARQVVRLGLQLFPGDPALVKLSKEK